MYATAITFTANNTKFVVPDTVRMMGNETQTNYAYEEGVANRAAIDACMQVRPRLKRNTPRRARIHHSLLQPFPLVGIINREPDPFPAKYISARAAIRRP